MARTKNSTKCERPKHKPRVTKASLVSKQKKTLYKRGEVVNFSELTHKVRCGSYEGSKGKLLSKDSDGNVAFLLLINARGRTMKEAKEITLSENELVDVNSADMLSLVSVDGEEEEDRTLLAFEKTKWTCGTCNGTNTNDGSACNNVLEGGKVCGAYKPSDGKKLGWGDCFQQNSDETWTCGICTVKNAIGAVQCIACEAKKPNSTDEDEKIAALSAEVKNYSISAKGKRRKLEGDWA
eukprot:scaffold10854_cov155-Skeletonema_dohrnii-CCMP3373.AAC.9